MPKVWKDGEELEYAEDVCDRFEAAHRYLERAMDALQRAERWLGRLDLEVEPQDPADAFSARVRRIAEDMERLIDRLNNHAADLAEREEAN